jgi:hypothetical protein
MKIRFGQLYCENGKFKYVQCWFEIWSHPLGPLKGAIIVNLKKNPIREFRICT